MIARHIPPTVPVLAAVLALLAPSGALAYSQMLNLSGGWNGLVMQGQIVTGFLETDGPGTLLTTNPVFSPVFGPGTEAAVAGFSWTNSAAWTNLPTIGLPTDMAGAVLDIVWTTGTDAPDSYDSFDVRILATNCATQAKVDFGAGVPVEADAYVGVKFLLQTSAPLFVEDGTINFLLPAMATLTAPPPSFESLAAVATVGRYNGLDPETITSYTRSPGDPALLIPVELTEFNQFFSYELAYQLITPHGTDPGVDYSFSGGGSTTVPEPSTYALLAMTAAGALWWARCRR